jgi:integrase
MIVFTGRALSGTLFVSVPVVFTKEEVKSVLAHLKGDYRLMAELLYGSGLRLMECVRLRVKDVDFGYRQIVVRDGKGAKRSGYAAAAAARGAIEKALGSNPGAAPNRTWHSGLDGFISPSRWNANTPMPKKRGSGSTFFPQRNIPLIRARGRSSGITSSKRICRTPPKKRSAARASTKPPVAIRSGIRSPRICCMRDMT